MFSPKNKKQKGIVFVLALFVFSSSIFFLAPPAVHADGFWGFATDAVVDSVSNVFKGLLYGIFTMFGWFASVAVTLFGWAIDPNYISGNDGLLNRNSVYVMWKFIRDFFNLFFILTLLYTAFTIVFQVAKDYKKTLLSIVLAALFVNFSFPLTRVIIDMTNVPMYYFVNQIGTVSGKDSYLGTVLSASRIQGILIPGSDVGISEVKFSQIGVSQILMAIVFLFIFSISLLVLAVLFVVRLAALIILLIFASVGFAASVIPGMEKYGNMWWEKLWQYSLFGPAAMLMLYIATQFFAEIAKDNTQAQFLKYGIQNGTPETAGFISSMAMFTIPIVMLWMAIGLATSFSIMGAGAVTGQGQKFIKWFGRKSAAGLTYPGRKFASGVSKGATSRFETSKVGRFFASPSTFESWGKGAAKGIATPTGMVGGAKKAQKSELQKFKDKQIHEQMAKDKENKISRTDALDRLKSTDDIMRISGAGSLANMDNGIQSMEDLTRALDALKKVDPATGLRTIPDPTYDEKALEIISKADKKIIAATPATGTMPAKSGLQNLQSVISSLGNNEKAINDLISKLDDSAFSGSAADYASVLSTPAMSNPNDPRHASLRGALEYKIKKEGGAALIVDHQINEARSAGPVSQQQEKAIIQNILNNMKVGEIADQSSLFTSSPYAPVAISVVQDLQQSNPQRYQEIKKQAKGNVASVL